MVEANTTRDGGGGCFCEFEEKQNKCVWLCWKMWFCGYVWLVHIVTTCFRFVGSYLEAQSNHLTR